jgi:hypothetical protein
MNIKCSIEDTANARNQSISSRQLRDNTRISGSNKSTECTPFLIAGERGASGICVNPTMENVDMQEVTDYLTDDLGIYSVKSSRFMLHILRLM